MQKRLTREALLDSALTLLEDRSFDSLSLREVARGAGVVPTAFYRHFDSLEQLGLVLVGQSFQTLREMIRAARADPARFERVIRSSVEILIRYVHENRPHFRFITRERSGGSTVLRTAISNEIRLFASELATDLARFPYLNAWSTEDLQMMAGLIVNAMVATVEAVLDAPTDSEQAEEEAIRVAEKQLRLITLGVPSWQTQSR